MNNRSHWRYWHLVFFDHEWSDPKWTEFFLSLDLQRFNFARHNLNKDTEHVHVVVVFSVPVTKGVIRQKAEMFGFELIHIEQVFNYKGMLDYIYREANRL